MQESINGWTDDFWEKRITSNNGIPGTECRVHWFNHCCPAVNHAPWSGDEEAQLLELVEQNKKLNVRLTMPDAHMPEHLVREGLSHNCTQHCISLRYLHLALA